MSWTSKVVWSEGLFLRPHHLQQSDRYLESLVETLEVLSDPEAMAAVAEDRSGTGALTTGQEMAAIMAKRLGRGAA